MSNVGNTVSHVKRKSAAGCLGEEPRKRGAHKAPADGSAFRAEVEYQGSCLKVHVPTGEQPEQLQGKRRRSISSFSRRARLNLISQLNRVRIKEFHKHAFFITLTYAQEWPTPKEAKRHFNRLWKRVERRYPGVSAFWKLEPQKRGAPHFHLMYYSPLGAPSAKWIAEAWGQVIGVEFCSSKPIPSDKVSVCLGEGVYSPIIDVQKIVSINGVRSYVAKYLGKECDGLDFLQSDGSSLVYGANMTAQAVTSIGRFWGIKGRKYMPWGKIKGFTVKSIAVLVRIRRVAKQVKGRVAGGRFNGFMLYSDCLDDVLEYLMHGQRQDWRYNRLYFFSGLQVKDAIAAKTATAGGLPF